MLREMTEWFVKRIWKALRSWKIWSFVVPYCAIQCPFLEVVAMQP